MIPLCINMVNLGRRMYSFHFPLGIDFLQKYNKENALKGELNAEVKILKHDTFVAADFYITGTLLLICDRSLREFSHPIKIEKKIIFKYAEENKEISEDTIFINRKDSILEVGQLLYELIELDIPMKKLHPDSSNKLEDELVYSTLPIDTKNHKKNNPVWDRLILQHKHLKYGTSKTKNFKDKKR